MFLKREKFRDCFGTPHGMFRVNYAYRQQQQPVALDVITRE